jgi:hypothetical protein
MGRSNKKNKPTDLKPCGTKTEGDLANRTTTHPNTPCDMDPNRTLFDLDSAELGSMPINPDKLLLKV